MIRVGVVLTFVALSVSPHAQVTPPTIHTADDSVTCAVTDVPCRDWLQFRQGVVGPYQSFAVATHQGHATVILSEPSVSRADFLPLVDATFSGTVINRSYRRWTTGLDGWLEDLVLDVRLPDTRTVPVISGHDLAAWKAPA